VEVEPATYAVQVEHATAEAQRHRPGGKFCTFNVHGTGKMQKKNKTNTDPNPTTNPNPKPTVHKAAKRKELNKVP